MTVTTWTRSPASVLRKTARVAVRVLPSPVLHLGDRAGVRGPCRRSAGRRSGAGRACACRPRGQSANASGSRSSSGSPSSRARSRSSSARCADLGVVEQLELGLEAVDRVDPLLVFLELAPFAEAQGLVDDSPCHQTFRVALSEPRSRLAGSSRPVDRSSVPAAVEAARRSSAAQALRLRRRRDTARVGTAAPLLAVALDLAAHVLGEARGSSAASPARPRSRAGWCP